MSSALQKHRIVSHNVKATDIKRIVDIGNQRIQTIFQVSNFFILLDSRNQLLLEYIAIMKTKPFSEVGARIARSTAVKNTEYRGFQRIGQCFRVMLDIADEASIQQLVPLRCIPREIAETTWFQASNAILPEFRREPS